MTDATLERPARHLETSTVMRAIFATLPVPGARRGDEAFVAASGALYKPERARTPGRSLGVLIDFPLAYPPRHRSGAAADEGVTGEVAAGAVDHVTGAVGVAEAVEGDVEAVGEDVVNAVNAQGANAAVVEGVGKAIVGGALGGGEGEEFVVVHAQSLAGT